MAIVGERLGQLSGHSACIGRRVTGGGETDRSTVHHGQSPALAAGRCERAVGVRVEGINPVWVEVSGVDQADVAGRIAVLEHLEQAIEVALRPGMGVS